MTELETLIESYCDGTISPAGKQRLLEMLGNEHAVGQESEYYRRYIQLMQGTSADDNRRDPHFQQQWKKVQTRLAIESPVPAGRVRSLRWKWYAAAAVVVLLGCCYGLFHRPGKSDRLVRTNTASPVLSYTNNKNVVLDSLLPDGSAVELYPGSALNFTGGYDSGKREIHMTGKILFTVFRDLTRPFTVYAGDFSTTALGTRFEVNTNAANKFSVKLLSGKVVVRSTETRLHPMTDIYLQPGQRLIYDLHLNTPVIDEMDNDKKNGQQKGGKNGGHDAVPEITFSDLPLTIVFRQLEQEYGIEIDCDSRSVADKTYSGAFLKTDKPDKVLDRIARKCNLHIDKEGDVYRIE